MKALAALAFLFLVAACQTAPPLEMTAADRATIDAFLGEYQATALAGDWDAWTELWTADAVYMLPNVPPLVGRAAIRETLEAFPNPPNEMSVTLEGVDGSGKWAWVRGSFRFAMDASGDMPEMREVGSILWVLEKQSDGTWLLDSECYNSDIPLEMPPEGM